MLIIQLLAFAAVAVWGFGYYLRTTEPPQRPQGKKAQEGPEEEPQPPTTNRRQLERIAANCLWGMMTPTERQHASIFQQCRDASDKELNEIIRRYKEEY